MNFFRMIKMDFKRMLNKINKLHRKRLHMYKVYETIKMKLKYEYTSNNIL